jgi:hypothetical protein
MDGKEAFARLDRIEILLAKIAENTRPASFPQRVLNTAAAVISVLGIVAVVDQRIKWLWN